MLAQNFKSAAELKLDSTIHQALQKVLVRLETNDLVWTPWNHHAKCGTPNGFNMNLMLSKTWCGTVGCIAGWTSIEGNVPIEMVREVKELYDLFYPPCNLDFTKITVEEAARTLRHYLTTGEIDWSHVKN